MENKDNYLPRLIDSKMEDYLQTFGAISVVGPKWCGKTWSSVKHANSIFYLDDDSTKTMALFDLELILNDEYPSLIDEWTLMPQVWDKIRRKCDENEIKGKYILTCSTELKEIEKDKIFHSGAGRIGKLKMYPMSLYESKDSTGDASLTDMFNGTQKNKKLKETNIRDIAKLIIRGGWPSNLQTKLIDLIPKSYIEAILDKDINDGKKRDRTKMLMLLKSLARNESSIVSKETILKDITDFQDTEEIIQSRITLNDYLDVLDRLYLIENQEAYSENYRSKERLGKAPKRHFTDPSLACACLNLTEEKLLKDMNTFGFLFESLVERDLRIYIEYLNGHLYHFRDNVSGLEVDAILEFPGGDYGAIEIKLGVNSVLKAKQDLLKFYDNMLVKPKFMAIIVSNINAIIKDKETGIYILPITALKP